MKIIFVSIFILFGLSNTIIAKELDLYPLASSVKIHSSEKLGKDLRADFRKFKSVHKYYAAFVINLEENRSAWMSSHSLDISINKSLQSCQKKTKNKNACILYSTIVPKNYTAKSGAITLKYSLTKSYTKKYAASLKDSNFGAIAINNFGNWGWVTRSTKESAKKKAVENCNISSAKSQFKLSEDWAKVFAKEDHNCRILLLQKGGS